MGSVDELTRVTMPSKTEANVEDKAQAIANISALQAGIHPLSSPLLPSGTPEANVAKAQAIENISALPKAGIPPDDDDSDKEPCFPFEPRGKQKGQAAGHATVKATIRPVKVKSNQVPVKADKKEK